VADTDGIPVEFHMHAGADLTGPRAPDLPETFLLQHFRKSIETCYSQLTARFPKHIHAVTAQGFALKIVSSALFMPPTKPACSPQPGLCSMPI